MASFVRCRLLFALLAGFTGGGCLPLCAAAWCAADELHCGAASVSITPSEPVALAGQMRTRIGSKVQSECMASVLALESRRGAAALDQVVFVACDLVAIPAC